jgi:hypothetical protein
MSTVSVTQVIEASTDRVWRVFTDLRSRVGWLSTVEAIEIVTAGPFGGGTVWRETRSVAGGPAVTEEFHVVECTPGQRFVVASPGIGADYRMIYRIAPIELGRHQGGTAVTVVQDGVPSGASGRLLALVFGGLAARTVEGALRQDLRDLAAAAVAPASGRGEDPAAAA